MSNQELVRRALKRTEVLEKYNAKEEGVDLALLNFDPKHSGEDKDKQAEMFKKLEEVRRKDLQKESKDRQSKLLELQKQLNDYDKKEKELLVKKFQMKQLEEKGPDFLIDQELK